MVLRQELVKIWTGSFFLLTGGVGTGKSHLIRTQQYKALRLLLTLCHHPEAICVLLIAPTEIAAHNFNASTIQNYVTMAWICNYLTQLWVGNRFSIKCRNLFILIVEEI